MPNSPLADCRPAPVVARGLAPRGRVFDITLCWTLRGCGGLRWRGPRPAIFNRLALRAGESSAWRFCLAPLGLVFGRSLCERRNTSKHIALRICEHRKLHFTGASLELNGAKWSFPLTRSLKTAQNLPTSSDEVPLSSDEERATALRPGRTDPGRSASLPLGVWGIGPRLCETQYVQAHCA
jgi:hypothetical protein